MRTRLTIGLFLQIVRYVHRVVLADDLVVSRRWMIIMMLSEKRWGLFPVAAVDYQQDEIATDKKKTHRADMQTPG